MTYILGHRPVPTNALGLNLIKTKIYHKKQEKQKKKYLHVVYGILSNV